MSSVRKDEKRVAKRKQVYRPLLENAFTAEGRSWPHVQDQAFVVELLETKVFNRWKLLGELAPAREVV